MHELLYKSRPTLITHANCFPTCGGWHCEREYRGTPRATRTPSCTYICQRFAARVLKIAVRIPAHNVSAVVQHQQGVLALLLAQKSALDTYRCLFFFVVISQSHTHSAPTKERRTPTAPTQPHRKPRHYRWCSPRDRASNRLPSLAVLSVLCQHTSFGSTLSCRSWV